jgi:endonuclease/exonuclease/phosphatase family metal-dependent hydrolase
VLVRSWNLFHGNTLRPQRRAFLEEAVRRASDDEPDVLCLQEVPVWALPRLAGWSGMQAFGDVAARPVLGPLPITAGLGKALTSLHEGLLRSAFSGQANAILVGRGLGVPGRDVVVLNTPRFRRAQARWLGLDLPARLAWTKERRICQTVTVLPADGSPTLVANLHATSYWPDQRLPDAELYRAAAFVESVAEQNEIVVLAGDFNTSAARSRTLADLTGPEGGYSPPGPRIDHILVRGAPAGELRAWTDERRRFAGSLLSDHAPIELEIG